MKDPGKDQRYHDGKTDQDDDVRSPSGFRTTPEVGHMAHVQGGLDDHQMKENINAEHKDLLKDVNGGTGAPPEHVR